MEPYDGRRDDRPGPRVRSALRAGVGSDSLGGPAGRRGSTPGRRRAAMTLLSFAPAEDPRQRVLVSSECAEPPGPGEAGVLVVAADTIVPIYRGWEPEGHGPGQLVPLKEVHPRPARSRRHAVGRHWPSSPRAFPGSPGSPAYALRSYAASTCGMISSFSRLRSSSVFETGTSANGGQMSSIVSPASFSRLRLSVICAAVPTRRLLALPRGV